MEKLPASPPHVLMPSTGELQDAKVDHVGSWAPRMCTLCSGSRKFIGYAPNSFTPVEYECDCEAQLTLQRWMSVRGFNMLWQGLRTTDMVGMPPAIGPWFADFYENMNRVVDAGYGAVLIGNPGSGKTAVAVLLAKAAMFFESSVQMIMASHFLADALGWSDKERFARWEHRVMASRLLVIDDFGREGASAEENTKAMSNTVVERKIEGIVRERLDRRLSTIITTNFDEARLKVKFGDRVMGMLRSRADFIQVHSEVDWRPDERKRNREEMMAGIQRPAVFW